METSVSLLMPIYNEVENLQQVLPLYSQYFDEIVIIHDGPCTDGSLELASSFGAKVKTHETPERRGEAMFTRPLGLEMVSGSWVIVADADERLPEMLLQNMRRVAAEQEHRGQDAILLRRLTFETREGVVTRQVADQRLPRFFRMGVGITWPVVPHIEAQGWSRASKYLLCCARQKKYAVMHYNRAEDFPEKRTRYVRVAKELWPSLKGTEWEEHMRNNVFPALGIEVPKEEYNGSSGS